MWWAHLTAASCRAGYAFPEGAAELGVQKGRDVIGECIVERLAKRHDRVNMEAKGGQCGARPHGLAPGVTCQKVSASMVRTARPRIW